MFRGTPKVFRKYSKNVQRYSKNIQEVLKMKKLPFPSKLSTTFPINFTPFLLYDFI
jgi:hypothetical protein